MRTRLSFPLARRVKIGLRLAFLRLLALDLPKGPLDQTVNKIPKAHLSAAVPRAAAAKPLRSSP